MKPYIHKKITKVSLRSFFEKAILEFIAKANVCSDKVDYLSHHAQHFSVSLKESLDYVEKLTTHMNETFKGLSETIKKDGQLADEATAYFLYAFGRLTHAIQDIYAHTNYINITGPKIKILDLKNIPISLKTCNFNLAQEGIRIFFKKPEKIIKTLIEKNKLKEFYSFCKDPRISMDHFILAKDEPGSLADLIFKEEYGKSGFKIAKKDAIKHTRNFWKIFISNLNKTLGEAETSRVLDSINKLFKIKKHNKVNKVIEERMEQLLNISENRFNKTMGIKPFNNIRGTVYNNNYVHFNGPSIDMTYYNMLYKV